MRSTTSSHTAARFSSGLIVGSTVFSPSNRCLAASSASYSLYSHQRSSSSKARDRWPEAETTVLPACERRPPLGENQADESASNRENPPGRRIRRVPFVRVSAVSGLL